MEKKDLIKRDKTDQMSINNYIEFLTNDPNSVLHGIPLNPDERKLTRYEIGMYSHLRDSFHAQTLGEARLVLEQRKIAPKIVKLWIEEGMALDPREFDAISKGYPEFQEDMEILHLYFQV